jgi:hypothetical protein
MIVADGTIVVVEAVIVAIIAPEALEEDINQTTYYSEPSLPARRGRFAHLTKSRYSYFVIRVNPYYKIKKHPQKECFAKDL